MPPAIASAFAPKRSTRLRSGSSKSGGAGSEAGGGC